MAVYQVSATTSSLQWLAAAIGLAVVSLLLLLGLGIYVISPRRHEQPDERQLKQAIAELRVRLRITAVDGYLLTSERSNVFWSLRQQWQKRRSVVIQRSFVEAAARLLLFQDFDIHQFDAFCICLRCSREGDESVHDTAPPEYHALCDWLLDICTTLVRPALAGHGKVVGRGSFIDRECSLAHDERFHYFQRVCRARVWSDMGGRLFQRLKRIAQARICGWVD
jgi:hypothetical protein